MRRDTIFYQLFVQSPSLLFVGEASPWRISSPTHPQMPLAIPLIPSKSKKPASALMAYFCHPTTAATPTLAKSNFKKTTCCMNESSAKLAST
jgi:hypothetical protein